MHHFHISKTTCSVCNMHELFGGGVFKVLDKNYPRGQNTQPKGISESLVRDNRSQLKRFKCPPRPETKLVTTATIHPPFTLSLHLFKRSSAFDLMNERN